MRLPVVAVATAALVAASLCSFTSTAFAQDPPAAPAAAPPPPALPAPAPAQAHAPVDASCVVDRFVGVSKDDAEAIELLVCAEIRSQLPYGGRYHIRVAKLGGKIVLTLVGDKSDGGHAEKQLVLSGLDEVPVATPRLVEAMADQKHVVETQTVTNIVGEEARTHKKKQSEIHMWLGMIGAVTPSGQGAGAHLGFSAGSERWSFVGDLRAAGGAFSDPAAIALTIFSLGFLEPEPKDKFSFASLSGGVRHHFSPSDTSVFLGGGLALDYVATKRKQGTVGMAGYAELGVDLLRTHSVGGAIALRLDAPAFQDTHTEVVDGYYGGYGSSYNGGTTTTTTYTPVVGGSFSLRF